MGVAYDDAYNTVYVEERHKNRIQSFDLDSGESKVFATELNSPIGIAIL